MDQNLRTQNQTHEPAAGLPPPAERNLEQEAGQARALLAAGADIIAKALSGDAEAFLRASRQHGGQ